MVLSHDLAFMRRALKLAALGTGQASPNPLVGAVLVRNGRVVGEGFHRYAEKKHAEVIALEQAGARARGATLYINLEPCSHHGRTPPCAEAVVRAGVRRVIAAMEDPNPLVAGQGLAGLRRAGVTVDVGLQQEAARRLNEAFIKHITRREPFVLLKVALSLDGKIATRCGHSQWITSERARAYGQKLRWAYDAILVGVDTILADNPELTMRLNRTKRRPLIKVIVDSRLRTPLNARVLRPADGGEVLIFTTRASPAQRRIALERAGATVLVTAAYNGRVDLRAVCRQLGERAVNSLLVEGGSTVHGSALSQGIVDKALFILAPMIIGGRQAIPAVGGDGFARLPDCPRLTSVRTFRLGPDLAVEGYLAPEPSSDLAAKTRKKHKSKN